MLECTRMRVYMCLFCVTFPVMMMEMTPAKNRLSVPSHKPLLCSFAQKTNKRTDILTQGNELLEKIFLNSERIVSEHRLVIAAYS
jgi:hypothetical protein